jgi:inner membrane protein
MEPVTHVLTGACLARAGLNRRAAYATAAVAVAAEFPDIDTLWALRGPVASFEHHRGITHTFLGLPIEAGLILLMFVMFHRFRLWRSAGKPAVATRRKPTAPVRWPLLYLFILLGLLSHLLLDYTNNYGLRPFLPFNTHWYAASIVFIFDPLLFLFLVAGLVMPSLFGLIGQEVGAVRTRFAGVGWARAALVSVALLWAVRFYEHRVAMEVTKTQFLEAPASVEKESENLVSGASSEAPSESSDAPRPLLTPLRSLASPDPLSVFRWYTATDFGPAYRLGVADSRLGTLAEGQILPKPAVTPQLLIAEGSRLGRVYLDWSTMPWVTSDELPVPGQEGRKLTFTFEDLRFMGATPLLHGSRGVPLTGEVVLDQSGRVVDSAMDGRSER